MKFTDRPGDRVVGVLGGMGPHATADFFALLVRLTPADKDWNHLHIVVDNDPRIPSRTRAFLYGEESPVPHLIDGAKRLVAHGAQMIVVPCNSASYFLGPVREAVDVPVVDPVGATALVVAAAGVKRPAVLGGMVTHRAELYGKALRSHGIEVVRPNDAVQETVASTIESLKRFDTSAAIMARTLEIIDALRADGADSVILGCTEFGLIAHSLALETDVRIFNSNELLARHAVALARGEPAAT